MAISSQAKPCPVIMSTSGRINSIGPEFTPSHPSYTVKNDKTKNNSSLSTKIKNLFKKSKPSKPLEIYHLGGVKSESVDFKNRDVKLNAADYFYERIPIKMEDEEVHMEINSSHMLKNG